MDEHGQEIIENAPLKVCEIVQPWDFDEDPDGEDYSGATEVAGASVSHYYRKKCIILLPRRFYVDLRFTSIKGETDALTWLGQLLAHHDRRQSSEGRADVSRLCSLIISNMVNKRWKHAALRMDPDKVIEPVIEPVVDAGLRLRDPEIIKQTAELAGDSFPPHLFTKLVTLLQQTQWPIAQSW